MQYLKGLILGLGILTASFFIFHRTYNQDIKIPVKESFPFESYFLSRDYPYFKPDHKAILASKTEIKNRLQLRQITPFDSSWNDIGPGNIGGRFNCIATDPNNTDIQYAGSPCGGIFKSTDGGYDWTPIFDEQPYLSVGHIALNPLNTNVIYAGTGDVNISGSPFMGNGVYKSTNAGQSWTHLGLVEESIISKIRVHPTDTNIVYASAMGLPFEKHNNRGLYKSTDGGQSWSQVLFINDSTGIIDLAINPKDPDILYACGWNRIRSNQKSLASGPDARIYKTIDGGQSWDTLSNGLPSGRLSRVGIDILPSQPDTLFSVYVDRYYALKGVYATYNAGAQWTNITTDLDTTMLRNFGWYFGKIRVNPYNPDHIYVLGVDMFRTTDGGQSWHMCTPPWNNYIVHADKHDLIFLGAQRMLLATDGGLYETTDNCNSWTDHENIPVTQFYHVTYNPHSINTYWGGAQDNGTLNGDEFNYNNWQRAWGGDGFKVVFHPDDPNTVFVETQYGNVRELNTGTAITGSGNGIDANNERINWDMPYILSHHDPYRMYLGTHRVFINNNSYANASWSPISPDLTDGNIYGSGFHNISQVAESPLDENILYAGTSDGNIWSSIDQGSNWSMVSNSLPKRYVTGIYPSFNDSASVFICYSGLKYNDPYPHVFRSDDTGQSWIDISGDLPQVQVNDILAHPNNDSILFIATQSGVYGSINAGINWHRVGNNMPMYPVFDIEWHPDFNQLIAGTFARSMMLYDLENIGLETPPSASINEISKSPIRAYFAKNGRLNLESYEEELMIEIYDVNGKNITKAKLSQNTSSIDMSLHPNGMYILKYAHKNKIGSIKVLKLN